MVLTDKYNRTHDYLRVSLTDRCNLNCLYCNPLSDNFSKLQKSELLSFAELTKLITVFLSELGFRKIRFTGGEPFVRKEAIKFLQQIGELKSKYSFEFALTTNGTLIKDRIKDIKACGLDKLNISLDSLKPHIYKYITGNDRLKEVIETINAAEAAGFEALKINTVVMKRVNDEEIIDFVNFIKNKGITLRFIEYMPFSNNSWVEDKFISISEVKKTIEKSFDLVKAEDSSGSVAVTYKLAGFKGKVGFISPISSHFCQDCNRLRIKADGSLKVCLFSDRSKEVDLRKLLREDKASDAEIANIISKSLQIKEKEHASLDELIRFGNNSMMNTGG